MFDWIKQHPWLSVAAVVALLLVAWLVYRGAFGTAAVVGASGGLAHAVNERLRRQREAAKAESTQQIIEDEAAHERVLTELERRRVADDEIAGVEFEVDVGAWDATERRPPP